MHHILEVGSGEDPAIRYPGTVLRQDGVVYTALDALPSRVAKYMNSPFANPEVKERYAASRVIGDSAQMPFADQSFDFVVSRSVFGNFAHHADTPGIISDNAFAGLYEAFRVLREGGQVVIAEENTPSFPATPCRIGSTLLEAGFDDIVVYPYQDMKNPHWVQARGKFWNLDESNQPCAVDSQRGFLIQGTRPRIPITTFAMHICRFDLEDPTQYKWEERTFQQAAQELPETPSDPYARQRLIRVVTADETTDLGSLLDRYDRTGQGTHFSLW